MKIAIVHDWIVSYAGSERVLEQMLQCYPEADLYSVVDFVPEPERGFLRGKKPKTTFIQHLPGAKRHYRNYLLLMPLAIEQLDMTGYDLIISSSHAVAKGILVSPDQLHLCMCYTPLRYAWDMQHQYLQEAGLHRGPKAWAIRWMMHKMRIWDTRTANSVDHFIAISHYIGRRIEKCYRRQSTVIYPPIDLASFTPQTEKTDTYFTASRFVPYKKIQLIIQAFNQMPEKQLIVMGDGPEFEKAKTIAGPNIQLLGHQPTHLLREHLQKSKAFIFAAEEDFGIAPLEAQACGTPVIAFGKGGALETIRGLDAKTPTGVFFHEQTEQAIIQAIDQFEAQRHRITPQACRENAARFSQERFRQELTQLVQTRQAQFSQHQTEGTQHQTEGTP